MAILNLDGKNNAFVESYLQAIHDFVEQDLGTGFDFVKWWHEEGSSTSINAAESMDAVQIVTIHKSKGLQYPVVLLPFAVWKHNVGGSEAWVKLNPAEFEGLDEMILPLSKDKAPIIGGNYEEEYIKLKTQEVFDSLNMLYVACTRAVERLYISFKAKPESNEIGSILQAFLETQAGNKVDEGLYRWGEEMPRAKSETQNIAAEIIPTETKNWQERLKIAHGAPPAWHTHKRDARMWGNRVHFVLSRINTVQDVEKTILQLSHQGTLTHDEIEEITNLINQVINHPQLAKSFANGNVVYNERDILLPTADRKRPDRLVRLNSGETILIDYKTGEKENQHKKQLSNYAELLQQVGVPVDESYLVYINEAVEVVAI